MTREYGQIRTEEMSEVTVLEVRAVTSDSGRNSTWNLKRHTAGWEPAGSVARWTDEKWSVTNFDTALNATFGNSFLSEADARAVFHSKRPWYVPKKSTSI